MKTLHLFTVTVIVTIAGCGPQYALPETKDRPGQIVVSAYTQNGCFEELQEAAKRSGVDVRLKEVQTDLGWEIFLFPFYQGYKCIGEITGPARR
ncbi:MAG TPA: hypothetical protein VN826_13440 [Candidatus Eisenbacteria bacterium]|jgi:hypothetical protein|nr:hypothetical protein [Candidatus Eisenbacteria bacterium]